MPLYNPPVPGYGLQFRSTQFTQLSPGSNGSGTVGTINQARAFPFMCAASPTLSVVYLNVAGVTGTTAGFVIRLAIYESDVNGQPGSLLSDLGTVAGDATGEKSISSLSVGLIAGKLYHFAYVGQGSGTPPTVSYGTRPPFGGPNTATNWTDSWWGAFSTTTISGAFPATFPWASSPGAGSPTPALIIVKPA